MTNKQANGAHTQAHKPARIPCDGCNVAPIIKAPFVPVDYAKLWQGERKRLSEGKPA